jgi:hypothetical protein
VTEIALAFFIGFLIGLVIRKKDPSIKEQTDTYNRKYQEYEQEIKYYKDLCHWHVQQKENK